MQAHNDKACTRNAALKARDLLYSDKKHHAALCQQMQRALLALPEWDHALNICLYCSIEGEVSTEILLKCALESHKNLLLPVCRKGGIMHFAPCASTDDLTLGKFRSIPEPKASVPPVSQELMDNGRTLVIVPGLTFDRTGYRIGYGGGYYDRFLARVPAANSAAMIFNTMLLDALPHDPWDIPVSIIITESEIIRT